MIVKITVAIPTFGRDQVLVGTIRYLLDQNPAAAEILVMDQTPKHDLSTEDQLRDWDEKGIIRWLRLEKPSITASMNVALREANYPIVLFVDDDIVPRIGLVGAHASVYEESDDIWAVSGQVLQQGEEPATGLGRYTQNGLAASLDFSFYYTSRAWVQSAMAGNLSVLRERALEIGGFDENFVGVAYRFETEFCRRIWKNGGKVLFEPAASVRHLRVDHGGIRRYGNHFSSPSPAHGVGDYYFALRQGVDLESILYMLKRPFRETCTRFHLRKPWYIPVKWVGELSAMIWATALALSGPRYISSDGSRKTSS
jgi:glycosyltransferase involved in cell wall biosynthesis